MKIAPMITAMPIALALFAAGAANAAEVKVLASTAIKTALEALAPQFETASGHKLVITYGASARLQPAIEKGLAFDLAILSTTVTDALVKQGRLLAARASTSRSARASWSREHHNPTSARPRPSKRALLAANQR